MQLPLNVIGLVQNFNVEQLQSMVNVMMSEVAEVAYCSF